MSKQFLFKILLCGDGAVGKTSIREQYMGKGFAGSYMKTIGADFASHKTEISNNSVTYQIFDLAGQDAYTVARKSFYKGGQAAFLIFDLQDPSSLHNLNKWISDCVDNSGGTIGTFVVLGNKADLVDTRQVSNQMAIEYCQRISAESGLTFVFLETSAKTGLNVGTAFDIMGKRLLEKHNIDVHVDFPEGTELITPSGFSGSNNVATSSEDVAKVAAVAEESSIKVEGLSDDMSGVTSRIDKIEERLDSLEKRFGKLAQLMKKVMEK
ncbi:MAG: GTP-binding protein [Candidatus Heimdallarchaeota archaeon]|nr:GTP-binding protein [Candidatus Heimdallarchaeota archaeon]